MCVELFTTIRRVSNVVALLWEALEFVKLNVTAPLGQPFARILTVPRGDQAVPVSSPILFVSKPCSEAGALCSHGANANGM